MGKYDAALYLLFRELTNEQEIRFIGAKLRLMSSASCVLALGYLSSGQLSDVMAMLEARAKGNENG